MTDGLYQIKYTFTVLYNYTNTYTCIQACGDWGKIKSKRISVAKERGITEKHINPQGIKMHDILTHVQIENLNRNQQKVVNYKA